MNKAHAGKLKRLTKWGFSGSEDKIDPYETQASIPQLAENPYSLESEDSYCSSFLGHQASISYDSHVQAMEHSKPQKNIAYKSQRPVTEYISSPSQSNADSQQNSARMSLPPLRSTLFPHIPNLMKGGPPLIDKQFGELISTDSLLSTADELLLQMLVTKSLSDCQTYGVLPLQQLDTLKKEEEALKSRIIVLTTKLALESKVKEGAQTLVRLHASNKKFVTQAQEQLIAAQLKVDEIAKELWNSQHRWWEIQRIMNEHHAAVLGVAYQRQERDASRLKENLKLREGQAAVADGSFFNGNDESVKVTRDPSKHQMLQNCLEEALSIDLKSQNYTNNLASVQPNKELSDYTILNNLRNELESSRKQIIMLENQLSSQTPVDPFISNSPSSIVSEEVYSRLTDSETTKNNIQSEFLSLKEEHSQLLQKLEFLFSEIPGPESEDDSAIVPFSIDAFIQRVDNLVEENNELIDRVLALQETNPESNRDDVIQLKDQIYELNKSLSDSQTLITSLEEKLEDAVISKKQDISSLIISNSSPVCNLSRKNTGMYVARGSTLQAELAAIVEGLGQVTNKSRSHQEERLDLITQRDQLLSKVEAAEAAHSQLQAELDLKFQNESSESRREMRVEFRQKLNDALANYRKEAALLAAQNRALKAQLRDSIVRSPTSISNSLVL